MNHLGATQEKQDESQIDATNPTAPMEIPQSPLKPIPSTSRSAPGDDTRHRPFHHLPLALFFLISPMLPAIVSAHGTVIEPRSRVYRVYQDMGNGSSAHPATIAAVNHDGGQANAYFTWNQVAKLITPYTGAGSTPYQPHIPDGQLASGASGTGLNFSGLDLVSNDWDWPATTVSPGPLDITWYATATHDPSFFKVWITKADYNHKTPLAWDKMEYLGRKDVGSGYTKSGANYLFSVDLPERSGRHVLHIIWQRVDPAGEAFFAAVDLNFDSGGPGPVIPPAVGTSDQSVLENAGSVGIPVTLSKSVPGGTTGSVVYTTTGISATPGTDYTSVTGTLTFQPNQLTKNIVVPILDDSVEEVPESFRVTLSNPIGLELGTAFSTVTINDDDLSNPGGYIFDKTQDWGSGYQGWLRITNPGPGSWTNPTVTFDLPADQGVSFFGGGTRTDDGAGHHTVTGVGAIAPGETKSFDIVIQPAPGVNSGPTNVRVNGLLFDLIAPSVSVSDVEQAEGDTAGRVVSVTVRLASAHTSSIHVSYTTADGSAVAGTDYTANSGNMEFTPGQTQKTISFPYDGNLTSEGDKDFFVVLGAVTGEELPRFADGGSQATVTLTDDDGIIHLTATGGTVVEGDSGTRNLTIRLFLDRAVKAGETVSVGYYSHDHGATKNVDYVDAAGVHTFSQGQTGGAITVPILGDSDDEVLERFMLHFQSPVGIEMDTFHAVGQIVDDDFSPGAFGGQRVVAYVDGTGGGASMPPANRVTHICLAFSNLNADGTLSGGVNPGTANSLKATNPDLKVLLSVGGWTWSANFSSVAADPVKRAAFASSCRSAIVDNNIDGIDIDWEWPGVPGGPGTSPTAADGHNYTLLVAALRTELDDLEANDGEDRHYEITAFVPAGSAGITQLELPQLGSLFDFLNVQGYDLHGSWESRTGHQAGLHHNPADPASNLLNIEAILQMYIDGGFPKEKLLVGAPFYARGWGGVPDVNNGAFQSGGGGLVLTYAELQPRLQTMPRFWDDHSRVPFLYDKSTGEWISYDDPQAMYEKSLYSLTQGFGGVFYWQDGGDSSDRQLIITISDTLASADADADGLTDSWEQLYFGGLDAANGTTNADGDPLTDLQEEMSKTDPLDPADFLRLQDARVSGGNVQADLFSKTGVNYQLFFSENLLDWTPLETAFPGTGGLVITEAPMVNDRGFFRVQVVP